MGTEGGMAARGRQGGKEGRQASRLAGRHASWQAGLKAGRLAEAGLRRQADREWSIVSLISTRQVNLLIGGYAAAQLASKR